MTKLIQNIFKQANKLYSNTKLAENETKSTYQLLVSLMSNVKADDLSYNQAEVDRKILVEAPTAYSKLFENDFFNLSLFSIGPNSRLPLHNHPGMDGFLKVISGKVLIKTFDQLPQDVDKPPSNILSSIPYKLKSSSIVPTRRLEDKIISADDQSVALIEPEKGNIHEITVSPDWETGSAFLDLIAPPYDRDSSARSVSYYRILGDSYSSKLSADITWLLVIPPPNDYWCAFIDYKGPELNDKILNED